MPLGDVGEQRSLAGRQEHNWKAGLLRRRPEPVRRSVGEPLSRPAEEIEPNAEHARLVAPGRQTRRAVRLVTLWRCQGQGERHQERQSLRPPPSAGRDGTANPRRPGDSWEAWLSQDRGAVWCSDGDGAADRAGVNPAEKQRRREPAGRHHDAPQCRLSAEGAVEERALFRLAPAQCCSAQSDEVLPQHRSRRITSPRRSPTAHRAPR